MSERAPISRASSIDKPESLRESSRLLLLSTESMRARRRPFAVVAFGALQLLAGLALGWPAARTVASVYENHPRGDAPLFEDGGFALLRTVTEHEAGLRALTSLAIVVVVVVSLLGLVPVITLFASLAHSTPDIRTPRARHIAPFVATTYGSFAALWLGALLLKLAAFALTFAVFGALSEGLASRGEPSAQKIGFGVALVVGMLVPMIDVFQDLTRAALVRYATGVRKALMLAAKTVRRSGPRVLFSYLWRAAAGWVPILAVAIFASRFGGKAGGALLALFLLHQSVIFARAALRASWFARALRAVDEATSDP